MSPRDGSETYVLPFPDVEEDTTIELAVYNGFTNDVAQDLNNPRPVSSGGTGGTNPADAMQNLGGELAKYQVTNYDSHPFQAGSFYSTVGATGAPTGNAFIGICYVAVVAGSPTTDMFIEARDQATGLLYVRQKKANVWGGWTVPVGFSPGPTPPVGSAPNALWWDTTRGKLFFYYQDPSGPPAQWVEAVAVPDIDPNTFVEIAGDVMTGPLTLSGNAVNPLHAVPLQQMTSATGLAVAYTAQSKTAAEQTIARQNIYAAPFDAMAYNGMQVNGGMEVSQEKGATGTVVTNNNLYVIDGWKVQNTGAGSVTGIPATYAPSGFKNSIQVIATTANAAPAAGDICTIYHTIEGNRIAKLAWGTAGAQPVTIGFWITATRTGTYSGSIRNGAINRSYAFTYTIASGAWEYKTVTIPGDTAGTWPTDNNAAMVVAFTAMSGSTNLTAPGAWVAGNFYGATGQTNNVAAINDQIFITGVVVLPSGEAPTAARSSLIMRPYDQELVTCRRYWVINYVSFHGWITSGQGLVSAFVVFSPVMRATPTMTGANSIATSVVAAASYSPSIYGVEVMHGTTAVGNAVFSDAVYADARL